MLETLGALLSHHWFLAAYFGTMVFNEGVILAAFSFSTESSWLHYGSIATACILGVFTNDILLYVAGYFGSKKFCKCKQETYDAEEVKTIFQNIFFQNIFLTLLCIKFLFGMRSILTIYLVSKKKISFRSYCLYTLCGIILYVFVLGVIGVLIGQGLGDFSGVYDSSKKIVSIIFGTLIVTHIVSLVRFIGKQKT